MTQEFNGADWDAKKYIDTSTYQGALLYARGKSSCENSAKNEIEYSVEVSATSVIRDLDPFHFLMKKSLFGIRKASVDIDKKGYVLNVEVDSSSSYVLYSVPTTTTFRVYNYIKKYNNSLIEKINPPRCVKYVADSAYYMPRSAYPMPPYKKYIEPQKRELTLSVGGLDEKKYKFSGLGGVYSVSINLSDLIQIDDFSDGGLKKLKISCDGCADSDDVDAEYQSIYKEISVEIDFNKVIDYEAKSHGYENGQELAIANEFKAIIAPNDVRSLINYGVSSPRDLRETLDKIISEGYAEESSVRDIHTVLGYLEDEKNSRSRHTSALQEKKIREFNQKLMEKKKADEFNRENPFVMSVECTIGGRQAPRMSCFVPYGIGPSTTLEIRNGDQYSKYNYTNAELSKPNWQLSRKFSIEAQNSGDPYLLNIKIKNILTGKTIFEQSASKYQIIRYSQ